MGRILTYTKPFGSGETSWLINTMYYVDMFVSHYSKIYICISEHVSTADTEPEFGANWRDRWRLYVFTQYDDQELKAKYLPEVYSCVNCGTVSVNFSSIQKCGASCCQIATDIAYNARPLEGETWELPRLYGGAYRSTTTWQDVYEFEFYCPYQGRSITAEWHIRFRCSCYKAYCELIAWLENGECYGPPDYPEECPAELPCLEGGDAFYFYAEPELESIVFPMEIENLAGYGINHGYSCDSWIEEGDSHGKMVANGGTASIILNLESSPACNNWGIGKQYSSCEYKYPYPVNNEWLTRHNGKWYICLLTHISSSNNEPSVGIYWRDCWRLIS